MKGLPPIPNRPPILPLQPDKEDFSSGTNSWENEFKESHDDVTDVEFEWSDNENEGFEGSEDNADDDIAGASWSTIPQGGLEPPPLPDFED